MTLTNEEITRVNDDLLAAAEQHATRHRQLTARRQSLAYDVHYGTADASELEAVEHEIATVDLAWARRELVSWELPIRLRNNTAQEHTP